MREQRLPPAVLAAGADSPPQGIGPGPRWSEVDVAINAADALTNPTLPMQPRGVVGEVACLLSHRPVPAGAARSLLSPGFDAGAQTWVDRQVALAWAGAACIHVADDLVLLVEGRLDNRSEIAHRTGLPVGASVARLLTALWRQRQEDAVDLVVGEVAGIVLDRASDRVYAFRDLCAGRPLHVARLRAGWAIASEWRPLAFANEVSPTPSREWFTCGFVWQTVHPTATPYAGVDMVLPGHVATPDGERWRQTERARWHIPVLRASGPGAYAEEFRELFDEAVRCRTAPGGDRVGVCLSGGLDSTSVIATAAFVSPDQHRTAICMGMSEPEGDERILQRMVADRSSAELRWVDLGAYAPLGVNGPRNELERFGAPPLAVNWFLQDGLAETARQAGVSVVLSGEDGDGAVGGSPAYLADLLMTGRWLRWWREVGVLRRTRRMGGRELLFETLYQAAPPPLRRGYMRAKGIVMTPPVLAQGLSSELDLERSLRRDPYNSRWRLGRAFRVAQEAVGLTEQIGPVFTNIGQTWRPRGLQFTHPWCDRRLMSFCMGLPYPHVVADGLTKVVLRQAMADRLPAEVLRRRGKADISEAARRGAREVNLQHVKEGLALARRQPDWFNPTAVDQIESTFDAGEVGSDAPALRVAFFSTWLDWCGV